MFFCPSVCDISSLNHYGGILIISTCDSSLKAVGSEENKVMGNRPLDKAAKEKCWCTVLGFVFSGLQEYVIWYHIMGAHGRKFRK